MTESSFEILVLLFENPNAATVVLLALVVILVRRPLSNFLDSVLQEIVLVRLKERFLRKRSKKPRTDFLETMDADDLTAENQDSNFSLVNIIRRFMVIMSLLAIAWTIIDVSINYLRSNEIIEEVAPVPDVKMALPKSKAESKDEAKDTKQNPEDVPKETDKVNEKVPKEGIEREPGTKRDPWK